MKADEARKIYGEEYVEYEWLIKDLVKVLHFKYEWSNNTLNSFIKDIAVINYEKQLGMPIFEIKRQRRTRNWIVHSRKNTPVPEREMVYMKKIHNINEQIGHLIQKYKAK